MTDETNDAQISANLGDYATFKAQMLALIPRVVINTGGGSIARPLARLDLGVPADPTLAMVDAFAALADIVSFYQDRVLNEGYLGTATDYSSLALLGRSIGEAAGTYIGATAEIALFAQPGAPVTVPKGAAIQASPPKPQSSTPGTKGAAASARDAASTAMSPIFETAADVVVDPALNQIAPLQTRPVHLDPDTDELLISGTGLGLAAGDFMLLVRRGKPTQWVRLTVFAVSENHVLSTTTVSIGSSLQAQWTAGGATEPLPHDAAEGLELYALDLACRLFGYNAPPWSSQSAAVRRANTPTGMSPAEFTEWPGFGIAPDDLDLQAVYSKVLPGSQLLLETPESNTLGAIASVSRQNVARFGLTGQVTQVLLEPEPAVLPSGVALIPARSGVTASLLGDGRVLLAGGIGDGGVLDSVEIYDPATGLVSQAAALPSSRGLHTATTIDGVVYLVGGVTGGWEFASDILRLDPATLTFTAIPGATLAIPRISHAATALPDGTLMVSGGMTGAAGTSHSTLEALLDEAAATSSVAVFVPEQNTWAWEAQMQRARAGHSATLCPVVRTAGNGGTASRPPVGQIVVFLGGHGGGVRRLGSADAGMAVWDDAEVTDPASWKPVAGLYPIEATAGDAKGSPRYDHVATFLPGNNGFVVTGGRSASGPVGDNWLVGAFAHYADGDTGDFAAVPVFVAAPPLVTARSNQAAALLQGGKVVIAGGIADTVLDQVEIFSVNAGVNIPFEGARVLGPSLAGAELPQAQACAAFLALPGDDLLIAGGLDAVPDGFLGAVVDYDADVGTFITFPGPELTTSGTLAPVGSLALPDGTILILGTTAPDPFPLSPARMTGFAWTFDPTTNLSTITGAPVSARVGATLSLLANGTVLVAGGMGMTPEGYAVLDTAEIYDPKSRTFRPVHNKLAVPRCGHSATVLADGTVLLAGGYSYPAVTYDPPGVLATWVPTLDSAEIFDVAQQAFAAVSTPLPSGFAFHSATLLANGDVLIAGGVTDFSTERAFTAARAFPTGQAAVFNVAAQAFAVIAPLGTPRAMHSATLLPSGKVLVVGGVVTPDLKATATTELFDPGSYAFAPSTSIAEPRHSHGAILLPRGLLMIGGASTPTYELIPAGNTGGDGETAYPLPFALPSPSYPMFACLSATVTPIPIAGRGVYVFGGQVDPDGESSCSAMLYVDAPPSPESDARRQAMVYTQSRPLSLAPPIDDQPLTGSEIVLAGLIDGIAVGRTLLMAGNPPLAETLGEVTGVGGAPKLAAGTLIMVLAPVPSATGQWWRAEVPDVGELSIEIDRQGHPPSGLAFLSGNGSTVGNVTAQQLQRFTRPTQSEAITVKAVRQYADTNTTVVTLEQPLRYLYDRTTTSVYGNVVEVTQGSSVSEVLGSGDGQKPFQRFILKQAPLTWLEQADGSIAPQLTVTVNGAAWHYVEALGDCTPAARAYQLIQDAQGRAQIQFGDGTRGLRLPTGENNIAATYRVGAGANGNVPAGSITRPPTNVGGIKGVLNPVAATGGIGAPPRSSLRAQIPVGVADLGRIVTQDDMLTFVLNRPEVGAATLTTVQGADPVSLVTLAGPGNMVPDMAAPAFVSLEAAFGFAVASGAALQHLLLPYEPLPFKVKGKYTVVGAPDLQQIESAIAATLQSAYALATMRFGQAVRAADLCALILRTVAGIKTVTVTDLWAPTETRPSPLPASGMVDTAPSASPQALYPKEARPDPPTGAQILFLSTDADTVTFTLEPASPAPSQPSPAPVSGGPAS